MEGTNKTLHVTETQGKGEVTPQETELKLPARVGGSPMEDWVCRGSPQGWRHWQQQSGNVSLDVISLGGHH